MSPPHDPSVDRHQAEMAELLPLVPLLLGHIQRQAALRLAEVYRQLAAATGTREEAVKRNWLRWRSMTAQVGGRGRRIHSRSLSRLIQAADQLGWLKGADASGCGPLLAYLRHTDERHRHDLVASSRRSMNAVRRHVREVIRQREMTAYDDTASLSGIYELVAREVALELGRRLLGSVDSNLPPPEGLGNDLLSGSLSKLVRAVREAGSKPMLDLETKVVAIEARVRAAFLASTSDLEDELLG